MSITGRLLEHRGSTGPWGSGDVIPPPSGFGGIDSGGVNVSEQSTLSIMSVYACVRVLCGAVSTLPIDAFRPVDGGGRAEITPTPSLLTQPWGEISRQDWYAQVTMSMALRGNFYGLVTERDRLGYPLQIMPLHPDMVRVTRNRDTGLREYRVMHQLVDRADILHIPFITSPGALTGLNPIEAMRQGIALTIASEASGAQFFANGTLATGAITAPGDLNKEEVLALAHEWAAAHQGVAKAHLPAVLTGGATWTQLSVNPDDAQFLGTRAFQRVEIAMWMGIPPHMIGDVDRTTSWGTGIEQQEIGFVTNTLRDYVGRIELAMSPLIPGNSSFAKFNLRGRLRGDTLQRYQAYTLARNGSWMNPDEIRALEDMPPLPDGLGQDFMMPLNFVPIGTAPAAEPASGSTP